MLGTDEQAPIPRGEGWKPVLMNGERLYAKFAKVAINVVKREPTDGDAVPNVLTEVLEAMFGPGGYMPGRGNRVRIAPVQGEPGTCAIEPYRRARLSGLSDAM